MDRRNRQVQRYRRLGNLERRRRAGQHVEPIRVHAHLRCDLDDEGEVSAARMEADMHDGVPRALAERAEPGSADRVSDRPTDAVLRFGSCITGSPMTYALKDRR